MPDLAGNGQQWMDSSTAAEMLGRGKRTLRNWANSGRIERRYDTGGRVEYLVDIPHGNGSAGSVESD